MSPASVPAVAMASIAAAMGVFHLVLYLRLRRSRAYLSFAGLCLAVVLYDVLCAGLYSATTVAEGVGWQRLQTLALCAGGILLLVFILDYTGHRVGWPSRALGAVYLAAIALGVAFPSLLWVDQPHVKRVELPFGLRVTYQEGVSGPVNAVLGVALVGLVFLVMTVAVRFASRQPGVRGTVLVVSLAVFFLGVVNDSAVSVGFYSFVYTIEYAFLALVGLMGWSLTEELVRATATERALAETEERYRQLVEASPSGILLLEPSGRILFANPAAVTILGASAVDDLVGRQVREVVPIASHDRLQRLLQAALAGSGPLVTTEQEMVRLDGDRIQVAVAGVGVVWEGAPVVLAVGTDITARRRAEAERARLEGQLLHAQKLEAVGQLAGGVAHDFNNLLQALISQAETLRAHAHDPDRVRAGLEEVRDRARRGARLTRQLLLFARRDSVQMERQDLNRVVRETADLSRRLLPEHLELALELDADPLVVSGDRGQLEQVVMNLALNAAAAMAGGGRLTLRTRRTAEGRVVLEVEDTGSGIEERIRDRVFEPFFTTKAVGEGSGLGLAVVHGIVTAHHGEVSLSSEVGRGTVVRVELPAAEGFGLAEVTQAARAPAGENDQSGGERILVVEDEADTRTALCAILDALGYRAVGAGSGAEARRMVGAQRFDLVLTDVVLPDGRGNELARELVELQPDVAVLLMSGYAADWALREEVAEGAVAFLQKPFDMATLAERVRAELETSRGQARHG